MSARQDPGPEVVAVVVAYNRAELLRECLDALAAQDPQPAILVVNNASTDTSAEVIATHRAVTHSLELRQNLGGAGGFAVGIAAARKQFPTARWLWILDDDTIPTPSALGELLNTAAAYPGEPALLASRVEWTNGEVHPMNTHRRRPLASARLNAHAEAVGAMQLRAASFVSVLIDTRAVDATALPVTDYFIWNDDLEYTARICRDRVGLHVESSVVIHKTKALAGATDDPGDRLFYEVRNKLWFLTRSRGLRLLDRVLYGGSMLVRWARMAARSADRRAFARNLGRGMVAALKPPRPGFVVAAGDPTSRALLRPWEE